MRESLSERAIDLRDKLAESFYCHPHVKPIMRSGSGNGYE